MLRWILILLGAMLVLYSGFTAMICNFTLGVVLPAMIGLPLLAVGLFTRITSAVMTVLMIGAAFLLFPHQSFDQAELKVVYGGIYIFLLIAGAGRYSLDRLVCMVRRE